jgi:hypothetical protein
MWCIDKLKILVSFLISLACMLAESHQKLCRPSETSFCPRATGIFSALLSFAHFSYHRFEPFDGMANNADSNRIQLFYGMELIEKQKGHLRAFSLFNHIHNTIVLVR